MSFLYRLEKKIAHTINIPVSEISSYLDNLRYKRKPVENNIIVFSQSRSGSTLLENLLSSTGYFIPKGEIFDVRKREVKFLYLFISGLSKRCGNVLFHLKLYHLDNRRNRVDAKKFLEKLFKDGWYIVFLDRNNKIDQTLSHNIVKHRGNYHKTKNDKENFKFRIDFSLFKKEIRARLEERKREIEVLSNINYIYVNYEKDLKNSENHQGTVNRILDKLMLDHKEVSTIYKKINVYKPEDIIINYEEYQEIEDELKEKFL